MASKVPKVEPVKELKQINKQFTTLAKIVELIEDELPISVPIERELGDACECFCNAAYVQMQKLHDRAIQAYAKYQSQTP